MSQGDVKVRIRGENKDLQSSLDNSEKSIKGFGGSIKKIFIVIAAAMAFKKLFTFGKQLFDLYAAQEQSEAKLAAVIRATGGAAGFSADQMKKMAASLQDVSKHGDETIMESQALLATFKNIRGDVFKDAMVSMADMAEIMGTDLKGGAVQLGKALNDPIKGVAALARVGVGFTDSQKDMIRTLQESGDMMGAQRIILAELEGQFGGAAEGATKTFSGQMLQLKNRLGDIGERIFGIVVPAFEMLFPILEGAMNFFENLMTSTENAATGFGFLSGMLTGTVTEAFTLFVQIGVGAFTAIEVAFNNWKATLEIGILGVMLAFVGHFNNLKWWYTEVIPGILSWFFRNWKSIFTDIATFTGTVLTNMWDNMTMFFENVWAMISGGSTNWEWKSLSDGFESTLEELPKIAERKLSETEKKLVGRMSELGNSMSGEFAAKFAKNYNGFMEMFKRDAPEDIDDIKADLPIGEFDPVVKKEKEAKKAKAKAAGKKKEKEDGETAGSFVGLEGLNRQIQSAAAARKNKPENVVAEAIKGLPTEIAKTVGDVAVKIKEGAEKAGNIMNGFMQMLKDANDKQKEEITGTKDATKQSNVLLKKMLKARFVAGVK